MAQSEQQKEKINLCADKVTRGRTTFWLASRKIELEFVSIAIQLSFLELLW